MDTEIDLGNSSFKDWVHFVFEGVPSSPTLGKVEDTVWIKNKAIALEYCAKLFQEPGFLRDTYSPQQVIEGFELLLDHCCLEGGRALFSGLAWDQDLPWIARERYIASMGELFERLFAEMLFKDLPRPEWTGPVYMWWDPLVFAEGKRINEDANRVRASLYTTLCRILSLGSRECQKSALHGLGHLFCATRDLMIGKAIDQFLATHESLDKDLKRFAVECSDGMVQ